MNLVPGMKAFVNGVTDLASSKGQAKGTSELKMSVKAFQTYLSTPTGYLDLDGAVSTLSSDISKFIIEISKTTEVPQGKILGENLNRDLGVIADLLKIYDPTWATSGGNQTQSPTPEPAPQPVEKSNGIWSAVIENTKEGGSVGTTCDLTGKLVKGDLVKCTMYVKARNVSSIPQSLQGFFFAVVDGKIFQSNGDAYSEANYNPTQWDHWSPSFDIPFGGIVTNVFMAYSATAKHEFDVPFNVQIRN
jgi:hypothetical protein